MIEFVLAAHQGVRGDPSEAFVALGLEPPRLDGGQL
jgi:hypothetical protein